MPMYSSYYIISKWDSLVHSSILLNTSICCNFERYTCVVTCILVQAGLLLGLPFTGPSSKCTTINGFEIHQWFHDYVPQVSIRTDHRPNSQLFYRIYHQLFSLILIFVYFGQSQTLVCSLYILGLGNFPIWLMFSKIIGAHDPSCNCFLSQRKIMFNTTTLPFASHALASSPVTFNLHVQPDEIVIVQSVWKKIPFYISGTFSLSKEFPVATRFSEENINFGICTIEFKCQNISRLNIINLFLCTNVYYITKNVSLLHTALLMSFELPDLKHCH